MSCRTPLGRSFIFAEALAALIWLIGTPPAAPVAAQTFPVARVFSFPLGVRDGKLYGPHLVYNSTGVIIENTNYGIKNPSMHGLTCFGLDWSLIYHAGEDHYRRDGATTYMAEVFAVADGQVVYAKAISYPGSVIITKHLLPTGVYIYSMYGHLNNSFVVTAGQMVTRGQLLGTVMWQVYNGVDDSHLHWEMRYFFDGTNIYPPPYTACNGIVPARGYTYPQLPDYFPSFVNGYRAPANTVLRYSPRLLPMVNR